MKSSSALFGIGVLVGRDGDLDPVAGGQDHPFEQAGLLAQRIQRFRQLGFMKREPLAHLHRRGSMIQARDEEFHRSRSEFRPACATQVRAENATTLSVSSAALRPRHPADIRRKIMTR